MWGFGAPPTMGGMLRSLRSPLLALGAVAALAAVPGAAQAADPFWSNGVQAQQWGTNCSIVGAPYEELQVSSQVSYGGLAGVPKVGERFLVAITYGHPGYACAPGFLADVSTELVLPTGVQPAVDGQHGIKCYKTRLSDGQWVDVTNEPWAYPSGTPSGQLCKTTVSVGAHGGIDLGLRPLITGTFFQIVVPVVATRELKGAAASPADEFRSYTQSGVVGSKWAHPEAPWNYENPAVARVWATVVANPPSAFYLDQPATEITATTAKTSAVVVNHFASGTASLDLGTTTAYGRTEAVPIDGANDANQVWATWDGLQPGTTYHWRVRFAGANGLTTAGPDQTFTTAPAPPSTGGQQPGTGTQQPGTGTQQPSAGTGSTPTGSAPGGTTTPGTTSGQPAPGSGTTAGGPVGAPVVALALGSRVKVGAVRRGLAVPVRVAGAGTVKVVLKRGGKVVTRGTARTRGAGKVAVKLARAKGARAGAHRVEVTFTPSTGSPSRASAALSLR